MNRKFLGISSFFFSFQNNSKIERFKKATTDGALVMIKAKVKYRDCRFIKKRRIVWSFMKARLEFHLYLLHKKPAATNLTPEKNSFSPPTIFYFLDCPTLSYILYLNAYIYKNSSCISSSGITTTGNNKMLRLSITSAIVRRDKTLIIAIQWALYSLPPLLPRENERKRENG